MDSVSTYNLFECELTRRMLSSRIETKTPNVFIDKKRWEDKNVKNEFIILK